MTNRERCAAVERPPDKLSGTWVFRGTRVPVFAPYENLRDGATIRQLWEWFPGVEGWKVGAVIERTAYTSWASHTCRHRAYVGPLQ